MSDIFWPGDHRAGDLLSQRAFLAAIERVEAAWLDALVDRGIAPAGAATKLVGLITETDLAVLAEQAEGSGTPILPLLALMRERTGELTGRWLHRGLTSQDVVDTALVLCLRDAVLKLRTALSEQASVLVELALEHRATPMIARTLTQHAVPTTFGLVAAGWLTGVLDALEDLNRLDTSWPIQLGGAGGTLAASATIAGDAEAAQALVAAAAEILGLVVRSPWHTTRAPFTRLGDALVQCHDAWGHIANDVLVLGRPEIGELHEAATHGRGGSSTMPQKQNPVLAMLVCRSAIVAPQLAATLHVASSGAVDQRPAGAWHAEWAPLRDLARHAVAAASQTSELLAGLIIDRPRMLATLTSAGDSVLTEQRAMAALVGSAEESDPLDYVGGAGSFIAAACDRARDLLRAVS